MYSRILHSSITSYASKVKLVLAIAKASGSAKLDRQKLHRLGHLRNAFAHGHMARSFRVNKNALRRSGEELPYGEYLVIETMKGDGIIDEIPRETAFSEFLNLRTDVDRQLDELEETISKN